MAYVKNERVHKEPVVMEKKPALTTSAYPDMVAAMKRTTSLLRALSDPTRLRIMVLLSNKGELCVCDLMAALDLPQSTVSRHLATLRTAGWIEDRRAGMWMYYRVHHDPDTIQAALIALLTPHLSASSTCNDDVTRLAAFTAGKNCV